MASRDEERKENACMNFISTVSDYVIKTLQSEKTLIVVQVLAVVVIGIGEGKEAVEAVLETSLLLHQAVNVLFLSHGGVRTITPVASWIPSTAATWSEDDLLLLPFSSAAIMVSWSLSSVDPCVIEDVVEVQG